MATFKKSADVGKFLERRRLKELELQNGFSSEELDQGSSSTVRARKYKRILSSPDISYFKYNQLTKARSTGERVRVSQKERLSMRRLEIKHRYGAVTERLLRLDDAGGLQKIGWLELMFHIPSKVTRGRILSDPLPTDRDDLEIARIGFFQVTLAAAGVFDLTTDNFILDAKWGEHLSEKRKDYDLDGFGYLMDIYDQAMPQLFGKKLNVKSLASKVRSLLSMLGLRTKPVRAGKAYDVLYELRPGTYSWMEGIVRKREKLIWGEDEEN
jgi:hypothetical protein